MIHTHGTHTVYYFSDSSKDHNSKYIIYVNASKSDCLVGAKNTLANDYESFGFVSWVFLRLRHFFPAESDILSCLESKLEAASENRHLRAGVVSLGIL